MGRDLRHGAFGERLRLKSIAKVATGEAPRRWLLGRELERCGTRRPKTQNARHHSWL